MLDNFIENNEVFLIIFMYMMLFGALIIFYKKSKFTDEEYIKQLSQITLGFNKKPDLKALRRNDKRGIVFVIAAIVVFTYFIIMDKILK